MTQAELLDKIKKAEEDAANSIKKAESDREKSLNKARIEREELIKKSKALPPMTPAIVPYAIIFIKFSQLVSWALSLLLLANFMNTNKPIKIARPKLFKYSGP